MQREMGMKNDGEVYNDILEYKQLGGRFTGSRILVMGMDSYEKKEVWKELQRICGLSGIRFEIKEQYDMMRTGDCVLLFPEFGIQGNTVDEVKTEVKRDGGSVAGIGVQAERAGRSGNDLWHSFLRLTEQLEQIRTTKPRAVLLMSDTCVYGKVFGMPHALKEEETGYVCHTDSGDMGVQCMRMAEHLCARLAREEGIPVKIARVDRRTLMEIEDSRNDGKELQTGRIPGGELLEAMLRVLLDGVPGEAYNLPGSGECRLPESREDEGMNQKETSGIPDEEGHSALSPIRIVPDCGKAGRL